MILFNELADTCLGTAGRLVSVEIRPTPLELTSDFITYLFKGDLSQLPPCLVAMGLQ